MKGDRPCDSIRSRRASSRGKSGTENGSLWHTTCGWYSRGQVDALILLLASPGVLATAATFSSWTRRARNPSVPFRSASMHCRIRSLSWSVGVSAGYGSGHFDQVLRSPSEQEQEGVVLGRDARAQVWRNQSVQAGGNSRNCFLRHLEAGCSRVSRRSGNLLIVSRRAGRLAGPGKDDRTREDPDPTRCRLSPRPARVPAHWTCRDTSSTSCRAP